MESPQPLVPLPMSSTETDLPGWALLQPQPLPTGLSVQGGFFPSSQCCLLTLRVGPRSCPLPKGTSQARLPPSGRHRGVPALRVTWESPQEERRFVRALSQGYHSSLGTEDSQSYSSSCPDQPEETGQWRKSHVGRRGGATSCHHMTPQSRCKSDRLIPSAS